MTRERPVTAPQGIRHSASMIVQPQHTVPKVEDSWRGFVRYRHRFQQPLGPDKRFNR